MENDNIENMLVSKDVVTVIEGIYLSLGVTFDKLDLAALSGARILANEAVGLAPTEE